MDSTSTGGIMMYVVNQYRRTRSYGLHKYWMYYDVCGKSVQKD